ncbi:polysaccharide pyruvyl transferase family protein [Microbacterium sp. SD291]|uniref:polysaccharide pyruvyl transferase family protein n=1 Tax=Microbacterium sp. SD291 TaxID=2782007 RepID=UPI001A9568E4|nr:polysaccharide pyruvyl transferase family protein [Microbacterium sp. SD291]MBO0981000.1 polysaccharide pyruvyl transferase family protein [Microbacterium sp. SD291]
MRILIVSADRTVAGGVPANLGDAFLTDALADALMTAGNRVEVVDFGESRFSSGLPRTRADGIRGLASAIARNQAVVIGGGTLIQDDRPDRLIGGLARLCAVTALLARGMGKPVRFFGVGCDSIERRSPRLLYRIATRGNRVWVREDDSRDRFVRMFASTPGVSSDVALLKHVDETPRLDTDRIVLAMNRSEGAQVSPALLDVLAQHGTASFLSMDQQEDAADYLSVPAEALARLSHEREALGWEAAWHRIGGSKALLGSRMHALYMAAMLGVPMVAIGSREKVVSFAGEFGVPLIASLADYAPGSERPADPSAVAAAVGRAGEALTELVASLSRR